MELAPPRRWRHAHVARQTLGGTAPASAHPLAAVVALVVACAAVAPGGAQPAQPPVSRATVLTSPTPVCSYQVVNTFPHDPEAFTQGLVVVEGELFESTGLWGESSLRRVDLATGQVLQIHYLASDLFGEGLCARGGELVQLTYTSQLGFVYDRVTFEVLGTFSYPTQGWGITSDGHRLIMTDGTATMRFWDPTTFAEVGRVQVHDENGPVVYLNELEFIDRRVWANILNRQYIARIDPVTGEVTSWVDLTGILGPGTPPGPLNGIAFDPAANRLLVTGKLWPSLFEIEVVGCTDALVFSDGFESGSTAGWGAGLTGRGAGPRGRAASTAASWPTSPPGGGGASSSVQSPQTGLAARSHARSEVGKAEAGTPGTGPSSHHP